MKNFEHANAISFEEAVSLLDTEGDARIIAGGTDLLGEMKDRIIGPKRLVNIKTISDGRFIEYREGEGLRIGALTTLDEIEHHDVIQERYGVLSQAVGQAASPQLRNMGTIAGNLCQRPRCWYYRGALFPCLRKYGRRCFAVRGENKYHAVLGGGPCFIVHPSDAAPALIALGASLKLLGPEGERSVPAEAFFVGPRQNPNRENILRFDELLTEVRIPTPAEGSRGVYLKVKERKAWDFGLGSVATVMALRDGVCQEVRIVLGAAAPIPWRAKKAEEVLRGRGITPEVMEEAGEAALSGSRPMRDNAYKVPLLKTLVRRSLMTCVSSS